MKYYIIVGEASGDLHASHLMQALSDRDPDADFRFLGGDLMTGVGGTRVRHYRDLAYMGFIPVLLHLRTISKNMKMCKRDVLRWNPDALILVDYPASTSTSRNMYTAIRTFPFTTTSRLRYGRGRSTA